MERRDFLASMAAAPLAAAFAHRRRPADAAQQTAPRARMPLRQSVMASVWGTTKLSFEERCQMLARIGFKAVDLPTPEQVPILKKYGLTPALMTGAGTTFQEGLVRKELHDKFEAAFQDRHRHLRRRRAVPTSSPCRASGAACRARRPSPTRWRSSTA